MIVECDYTTSGTGMLDADVIEDLGRWGVKITPTGALGGGGWPIVHVEGSDAQVNAFLSANGYTSDDFKVISLSGEQAATAERDRLTLLRHIANLTTEGVAELVADMVNTVEVALDGDASSPFGELAMCWRSQ